MILITGVLVDISTSSFTACLECFFKISEVNVKTLQFCDGTYTSTILPNTYVFGIIKYIYC